MYDANRFIAETKVISYTKQTLADFHQQQKIYKLKAQGVTEIQCVVLLLVNTQYIHTLNVARTSRTVSTVRCIAHLRLLITPQMY